MRNGLDIDSPYYLPPINVKRRLDPFTSLQITQGYELEMVEMEVE